MTSIFGLRDAQHVAKSRFVKNHGAAPLKHQRRNNLNVDVEYVLAFVSCELDQCVHDLGAEVAFPRFLETRLEVIAPLNQQGGQISQEIVEADSASVLLSNKVTYDSKPMLSKWFEKPTVIDEEFQDKNLDVQMHWWVFGVS